MLPTNESMDSMLDKASIESPPKRCFDSSPNVEEYVYQEGEEVPAAESDDLNRTSPSDVMLSDTHLAVPSSSSPSCKPFFIMDMLERVSPKDLKRAQELLCTGSCASTKNVVSNSSNGQTKTLTKPNKTIYERSAAIGNGYNAKGIDLARRGIWQEALRCWENALEVRISILGETHVDVANTYNNIGIAQGKLGLGSDALCSLEKALAIRKQHHGLVHTEVAATMHNIGNVYQQDGDLEAALHCFCECKLQQEQILGSTDHVQVARACIAIGHCYYEADALLDAREAYLDALNTFQRIGIPEEDSEVNTTLNDIAELDQRILNISFT